MKKQLIGIILVLFLLVGAGTVQATLTIIGTATYDPDGVGGANPIGIFNLIWDDNNNGNSVVWLDYTNGPLSLNNQMAWAAGLDAVLVYHISSGYSVSWDESQWRLPVGDSTVVPFEYDNTTFEMGDLFYNDLALDGGQTNLTLGSTIFDNLWAHDTSVSPQIGVLYWSSTQYGITETSYQFAMYNGQVGIAANTAARWGIAIRGAQVTATDPVPEPTSMLLLGTGIASLAAFGRRKRN